VGHLAEISRVSAYPAGMFGKSAARPTHHAGRFVGLEKAY
jgi:hypothetical protein